MSLLSHRMRWSAAAAVVLGACSADAEPDARLVPQQPTLYELDLTDALPEQGLSFLGEKRPGLADALQALRSLEDKPLAKGLFVRLGPLEGHAGDLEDWAATFEAFRKTKRPVHCHFDQLDNLGYALASHCDVLEMGPAGTLDLVGLRAQVLHGRKLLETVGVQADLMQVGKYKGAAEPFTRDSPSDELRANLNGLLDDLQAGFRQHLRARNGLTAERIAAILDGGPYPAEDAKARGLVDAVAFDDAARHRAKAEADAQRVTPLFPEDRDATPSLRELLKLLTGGDREEAPSEPHLGLAFLVGDIVDGDQSGAGMSTSEPFVKALRRWADDDQVRAVVLRVESPGGSALASDRMWHAARRVAKRKPLVVSLGDMAASGGYYVASAGTHIVAAPTSIVGSIGVVGGKVVAAELAQRAGISIETMSRAKHAAWMSPFDPFSASERARLQTMLEATYDRFLARVSEGRQRPVQALLPAAEGRLMGGARAKELGLVDELGGLGRALEIARTKAGLPKQAAVRVWPGARDPLQALTALSGAHQPPSAAEYLLASVQSWWGPLSASALLRCLADAQDAAVLALPIALKVR